MRAIFFAAICAIAYGQGVNFYSIEKEIALGQSMVQEVDRQSKRFEDPVVQQYIERLGARLIALLPSDAPAFPYSFRLVSDAGSGTHEPTSLPGGFIVVPTSLILAAQDEAELAGMLAHSIAHVAGRHFTRQETRGQIANLANTPLIFMGGWQGYGYRQQAQLAIPLGFLTFARGFETQADKEAVRLLSAAGYDPSALPSYIERTQIDSRSQQFSPMPLRAERVEALRKAIVQLTATNQVVPEGFTEIQDRVRAKP